ncbi:MAG: ABC transporter permease subunit [Verrucomicrobia bacterium]|nr:ABC transporter permease subunit [Verrucomicrobiota bacterium]MCH8514670.1 ABC transporter permease [Kiritimatiellia bacterium]
MINCNHVLLIARGAVLEMLRRKDLAVLGLFMGLFLLLVGVSRFVGFDNPATGTFLLNLSLTLIVGLSHLIALTMSARQMPDELERRTLYPLLARPVRRADVILGKWSASLFTGLVVFSAMMFLALVLVPKLETYQIGTLLQLLVLQLPALAFTAALGLYFSMRMPRLLGLFLGAILVYGAGYVVSFGRNFPIVHVLPNPGRLNLVVRYTDGVAPLAAGEFLMLALYACLWIVLLVAATIRLFHTRSV